MNFVKAISVACLVMVFTIGTASSQDRKAEAVDLVNKAVAHVKAVGEEQAFKDFADKNGAFMKGEFYVSVSQVDGMVKFHPLNSKLNGRNMLKLKDTDGKAFVVDMVAAAKAGNGWVSYKWVHPKTKKIAQKHTYVAAINAETYAFTGYYE